MFYSTSFCEYATDYCKYATPGHIVVLLQQLEYLCLFRAGWGKIAGVWGISDCPLEHGSFNFRDSITQALQVEPVVLIPVTRQNTNRPTRSGLFSFWLGNLDYSRHPWRPALHGQLRFAASFWIAPGDPDRTLGFSSGPKTNNKWPA